MHILKSILVKSSWLLLGRRNLVRLGRFLSNEGRLDVANHPHTNGEYQLQRDWWRRKDVSGSRVVLDIGANVGEWSQMLVRQAPHGHDPVAIHAFEPCSDTHTSLVRNIAEWGLTEVIKAHPMALSSEAGVREFYSFGANKGINGFHPGVDPATVQQQVEKQEITTDTIDRFCASRHIERVHFIKIDTEGHDLDVIRGAQGMLAMRKIDVLQFEYNYRWILAQHFLRDAMHLLKEHQYRIGKVTPRGIELYDDWHYELETFRECNMLAVSPEVSDFFPVVSWWNS